MSSILQAEHILCSSSLAFLDCNWHIIDLKDFIEFLDVSTPIDCHKNKHPHFRWNPDTRCQDLLDLLDAAKAAHLPDIRKVRDWGVTFGMETLDESAACFREFRWFFQLLWEKLDWFAWDLMKFCISLYFWNDDSESFGLYNASKWPASGDKLHSSNQSSQKLRSNLQQCSVNVTSQS